MEMHVQQRSARFFDRAFERHLDDIGVIQMLRIPKIDNQMAAGVTEAVSFDKVVFGAGFPGKLTRLDRSISSASASASTPIWARECCVMTLSCKPE